MIIKSIISEWRQIKILMKEGSHKSSSKIMIQPKGVLSVKSFKNPETAFRSPSFSKNNKSLFITEQDQMQRSKVLWRSQKDHQTTPKKETPRSLTKECTRIKSWQDLHKMRIKFNLELLKRKSREEVFYENMDLIEKVEHSPPRVDSWNHLMRKKKVKRDSSSSLSLFEENMKIIQRIENTPPKVEPWNYKITKKSPKAFERQLQSEKIFEENMKMIQKIQNIPPKVDPWSYKKLKRNNRLIQEREDRNYTLLTENMDMIDRIENIPPKVNSWTNLKTLRARTERKKLRTDREFFDQDKISEYLNKAESRLKELDEKRKQKEKQKQKQMKRIKTLSTNIRSGISPRVKINQKKPVNFTTRIQGVKKQMDNKTKKLPPLTLMELKQKQKVRASEKIKPFFPK